MAAAADYWSHAPQLDAQGFPIPPGQGGPPPGQPGFGQPGGPPPGQPGFGQPGTIVC